MAATVIFGAMFLQVFYRNSIQSASRLSGVVVVDLVSTSTRLGKYFSTDGYFRDQSGNQYRFASDQQFLSVAEGDTLELSVKKDFAKSLLKEIDIYFVQAIDAVKPLQLE